MNNNNDYFLQYHNFQSAALWQYIWQRNKQILKDIRQGVRTTDIVNSIEIVTCQAGWIQWAVDYNASGGQISEMFSLNSKSYCSSQQQHLYYKASQFS